MRYSLVLILCTGLSAPANAQQRGGYVGLSAGSYRFEDHDVLVSDDEFSYGAFGGYRFSQSFAVEGSLVTTTDFEDILDTLLNSSTRAEYAVQTVRALGIVQRNKWELFGGLGYHQSDADVSVMVAGTVMNLDSDDRGTTALAGVQLDGKKFGYRLQYEWFDADERLDLSNVAFGWVVRF
jgi:outer membrane protein with beta-barrel domain